MSYSITYNNMTSESRGLKIVQRPNTPAPEPLYEPWEIPGRDGVLMPKELTYLPMEFPIRFNFMADFPSSWGSVYRAARRWLLGGSPGAELKLSDDSLYFYKVYAVRIEETERQSRLIGAFTAVFICDPFTYLDSGKTSVTVTSSINNIYDISHPRYYVDHTGSWTLTVNGKTFTGSGRTYIDTDKQIAYDSQNNLINTSTAGNFEDLYLIRGTNTVSVSSGTLLVVPNWRTL